MTKTSHQQYQLTGSVDKKKLVRFVKEKTQNIERKHVVSVINILFDYALDQLFKEKEISITNFINIILKKNKSHRARNYYTGEIILTKPYNKIYYSLNKKFTKKVMKHADTEAYFREKEKK